MLKECFLNYIEVDWKESVARYPVMMEETRRRWRGPLETLTVTENWSDGSKPSMVEMVCFMESFAGSETPLEITEVSRGSIRFNMFAITENPRSKPDLCVETKSSETPPPSTPEIRQLTVKACETGRRFLAASRWREKREGEGGGWEGWRGLTDRSENRERMKARAAEAAMNFEI